MSHTNLESYYKINFALLQHHKYSLTEIENMIPWEKEIYLALLEQYIEEENQKGQTNRMAFLVAKFFTAPKIEGQWSSPLSSGASKITMLLQKLRVNRMMFQGRRTKFSCIRITIINREYIIRNK